MMKNFTWVILALVLGQTAKAESLSKLFDSTQLWDTPAPAKRVAKHKHKAIKREVASEPAVVQTYVYSDSYSFSGKNSVEDSAGRDVASVAMKGRVIAVRRELGLTEAAAQDIQQEFLINAGDRLGLSKGTKLRVYRTLPVVDPYDGNKQHELKVDFATIEVVHVEDDVAVTKLVKMVSPEDGPYVGTRGILVGDYVAKQ